MLSGILGLLILGLDIWAVIQILQSGSEAASKVLWILLILLLPIIGVIIWYFAGPKPVAAEA